MNIFDTTDKNSWAVALSNREICPIQLMNTLLAANYEFFWHPLGFAMCRVADWGNVSLRIHIWPNHSNYQQTPSWLIHDHVFRLKSWIISGKIENQEYAIRHGGQDYAIYETMYDADKSILNKTNDYCSRSQSKRSVYSSGDIYEVGSGVFHESRSLSNRTVLTVCETINESVRLPRVLGSADGLSSYTYNRNRATRAEILELVKKI